MLIKLSTLNIVSSAHQLKWKETTHEQCIDKFYQTITIKPCNIQLYTIYVININVRYMVPVCFDILVKN